MNLIFINLSMVVGGQEIYLTEIVPLLSFKGTKILIIPESTSRHHLFRKLKKTKIVTVPSCRYRDFLYIKKTITMTASGEDILVFNGNRAIYCGTLIDNAYRKFAIQHSSLLHAQDSLAKKYIRIFLYSSVILKRYNALIGVSKHSVMPVLSKKNVHIVYNGIDIKKFKPVSITSKNNLRKTFNLTGKDVVLVMAGALNKNKGQLEGIRILEHLPEKFKLILAGEGPDIKEIMKTVKASGLDRRVYITGHIKDMNKIYSVSDLFLFLSREEGLPLAILEAMASGLPIITTPAGAVPEILTERSNCLFTTRNNAEDTAHAIKSLWKNKTLREKMNKNNRSLAKNHFSLERNARELAGILTGNGE